MWRISASVLPDIVSPRCGPVRRASTVSVRDASISAEASAMSLIPLAHVDEMPGDRGGGGHRRRHEVGAALVTLAALEIPVGGRGAALAGLELVGIHGEAHRAAGLAPFEAGLEEYFVEPFGLGLLFDQ